MKIVIMAIVLVVMMAMSGMAAAGVQTGWSMGTSNTYNGTHVMIDFEENVSSFDPIVCTIPGITFVTTGGNQWVYACMDGKLNMRNETSGSGSYVVNGYAGAWCGVDGDGGEVTFSTPVSHVSCLVSSYSGLIMEAYDSNDNEVTNSSPAASNGGSHTFTRLSVDREECDISYVIMHDSGNKWLVDDLIVGYEPEYEPACSEIVISMNGSDDTVCFGMTIDFTAECTDQYGYYMDCPGLTWESTDTRVGTMNGSVFTVDKKGNTTIEASFGDDVTSNPIDITVVPGQKMLAHCQKFIHSQGQDQWNESAWMNKKHPCE